MRQHLWVSKKHFRGATITEYAIIIALCAILAIGGLMALRNAILNMNTSVGNTLAEGGTISVITPNITPDLSNLNWSESLPSGNNPAEYEGKSFKMTCTSKEGCTMSMVPSSECTNATSAEGGTACAMPVEYENEGKDCTTVNDVFALARTVEGLTQKYPQLAPEIPKLYAFAAATCKIAGGGFCDTPLAQSREVSNNKQTKNGVPTYTKTIASYQNVDALIDIQNLRGMIFQLATNPPAGLNPEDQNAVKLMAAESYNIANAYTDQLKNTNGRNFSAKVNATTGWVEQTTPQGNISTTQKTGVQTVDRKKYDVNTITTVSNKPSGFSATDINLDTLRNVANSFLDSSGYPPNYTVKVSFRDAKMTDQVAGNQ